MRGTVIVIVAVLAAGAVALLGVLLGAWWTPFPVGLIAGVLLRRGRWAALAGAAGGLIAWAVPLEAIDMQYGLGKSALAIAAIMGFTGAATIPVVLTAVVGLLLGLTGAWLGASGRSLFLDLRGPAPQAVAR